MQVWNGTNTLQIQDAKNRHLGTITQLCRAIPLQLRHVSTIGKKFVKQQYLPTCPDNMVNFGPLTAEIGSWVWDTPPNFNGFCVLAALLHHSSTGHQPNFAALNRGRHLYSARRPSRWPLAHISSLLKFICYQSLSVTNKNVYKLNNACSPKQNKK